MKKKYSELLWHRPPDPPHRSSAVSETDIHRTLGASFSLKTLLLLDPTERSREKERGERLRRDVERMK
jgi:hypothetical protein